LEIEIMKQAQVILAILGVLLCSGCGTILVRTGAAADVKRPYPATRVDAQVVSVWGEEHNSGDIGQEYFRLASPFFLVDFPVSLITDTLCLPWDLLSKPREAESPTTN
jgi:uncharacterized protein YceK